MEDAVAVFGNTNKHIGETFELESSNLTVMLEPRTAMRATMNVNAMK
jgi:hypothetical protein